MGGNLHEESELWLLKDGLDLYRALDTVLIINNTGDGRRKWLEIWDDFQKINGWEKKFEKVN